jgi:hypothetical protein
LFLQTLVWLSLVLWIFPTARIHADNNPSPLPVAENSRYRIGLAGAGEPRFDPKTGGRVKFTFSVIDKVENRQYPVYLDNLTAKVNRLAIYQEKLIVMGEEATLHSSITSLIDLVGRQEIDSFIGFGHALSGTGRFMGYRKFYPTQTADPEVMSDLVLIYDLSDSADGNRMHGVKAYKNDPVGRLIEVGHPVFPEKNADRKNYRVFVREETARHTVIPNGFFWLDDDRKIAFVDRVGGEYDLVAVDISNGLDHPVIQKAAIDLLSLVRSEDPDIEAVVREAGQLKLESVQDMMNGKVRIRISSPIPLRDDQIEISLEDKVPTPHLQLHKSAASPREP